MSLVSDIVTFLSLFTEKKRRINNVWIKKKKHCFLRTTLCLKKDSEVLIKCVMSMYLNRHIVRVMLRPSQGFLP